MEFEIGIGKTARRAYGFDEVARLPVRATLATCVPFTYSRSVEPS